MKKIGRCMVSCMMMLAMLLLSLAGVPAYAAESLQNADGYVYVLDAAGNAEITGYTGDETALVIPAVLDGHPVTTIGNNAFYQSELTSVVISFGVTTISWDVFVGSNKLTYIEIPDSVTSIGASAFSQCDNLKEVKLGNGLTKLADGLFALCPALESIEIPDSVTEIEKTVFSGCSSLKNITLPSGLTSIGNTAFGRTALESITLPSGVTNLGRWVFRECFNLRSVTIPSSVTAVGVELFYLCPFELVVCYPKGLLEQDETVRTGVSYVISPDGTVSVTVEKVDSDAADVIEIPDQIMNKAVEEKNITKPADLEIKLVEPKDAPFSIVTQPSNLSLEYGNPGSAKLTAGVQKKAMAGDASFQWYVDGVPVSGATAESYVIPQNQKAGSYTYYCEISCGEYIRRTAEAVVGIAKKPITVQADSITKVENTENPVLTYTVPAGALVQGDTEEDLQAQLMTTAGKDSPAGKYEITGTITAENYDVTLIPGVLTVVKAAPKKGENIQDSKNKAVYKVVEAGTQDGKQGVVSYSKPVKKTAEVTVPATVKVDGITYRVEEIAKNAFKNNGKLTKVTIGKYVKKIGANAFYNCPKLKTVKMGSGVLTIGDKAFYKCRVMTKITIPAKVTKIGKQAFYGCKKLKAVTVKSKKLKSGKIGKQAFKGIYAKAVIKVPKSKYAAYKKLFKKAGVGSKAVFKKN